MKVNDPGVGADRFRGYEVSLDPSRQLLTFGRHRDNWEPIRDVPCEVPVGRWIDLSVRMTGTGLEVLVDGRPVLEFEDREHPLPPGAVGLRTWRREASFRGLTIQSDGDERGRSRSGRSTRTGPGGVSGMWRAVRRGSATGSYVLETDRPFAGTQCQRIKFEAGDGAIGVENRGLNRWGMNFVAGKPYEGYLWIRADEPAEVLVAAESGDGDRTLAEAMLTVRGRDWKRYDFTLTPADADEAGRLRHHAQQARVGRARPCLPATGRLGTVRGPARPPRRGRGADPTRA